MGWWGKVIGGAFGFMLGGPLGALFGAALGHSFDRGLRENLRALPGDDVDATRQERAQAAFFSATFGVMGHISKADGRVSQEEIRLAGAVMDQLGLRGQMRGAAQSLFNAGRAPDFPLDEVLTQFRRECRYSLNLARLFVEIQVQAAYADGDVHPAERRLLDYIAEVLGLAEGELEQLEAVVRAHLGPGGASATLSAEDAYAILGVPAQAGDADVKRAYRRLMNRHHPDKLVSKGLPEEMMQAATEKTREIKAAYDRVKEARGL